MGLLSFFKNQIRVQRAGKIAKDTTEREQLTNGFQTSYTEKRIKKLSSRIAKNKERQKIASENNQKSKSTTKNFTYHNSNTMNNGFNTNLNFNKFKKK